MALLPSSKLAAGFVQAHQIVQKVIEAKGGNHFLGNTVGSTVHCGVLDNFNKTSKGLGDVSGKTERI